MARLAPILIGTGLAAGAAIGLGMVIRKRRRALGIGGPKPSETVHSPDGTLRHYRGALPIEDRVFLIQKNIAAGVRDPSMRKLALGITRDCPARDGECEANRVFDYVAGHVRYTGDVGEVVLDPKRGRAGEAEAVDLYQTPMRTLEYGGGDCDDQATTVATLLALNGITPELHVTSNECKTDDHILAVAKLPKYKPATQRPVDTTLGAGKFGEWPKFCSKKVFPA